ncbi:MAG: sigma-70 family RNA polymerase sigma factor [Cetobacterium sp.]|uniref:sigma-70 family RNA polymerase sigma factor n=1 Tax=Cetobacterium sp. TaxID=2071632 RepID=UPI003F34BCAD
MTKKYDPIVLKNAHEGDEKAIEKILKTFKGYVIVWNRMFNGDEDSHQVGEIAIIEAIRSFDFKSKHNFSTYVYKKIKYAILNYLKKERKNIGLVYDENLEEIEEPAGMGVEDLSYLMEKLRELPILEQRLIRGYITGMTFKEIGKEINRSEAATEELFRETLILLKEKI